MFQHFNRHGIVVRYIFKEGPILFHCRLRIPCFFIDCLFLVGLSLKERSKLVRVVLALIVVTDAVPIPILEDKKLLLNRQLLTCLIPKNCKRILFGHGIIELRIRNVNGSADFPVSIGKSSRKAPDLTD